MMSLNAELGRDAQWSPVIYHFHCTDTLEIGQITASAWTIVKCSKRIRK